MYCLKLNRKSVYMYMITYWISFLTFLTCFFFLFLEVVVQNVSFSDVDLSISYTRLVKKANIL